MFSSKATSRLLNCSRNGKYLVARSSLHVRPNMSLVTSGTYCSIQKTRTPPRLSIGSSCSYATQTSPPKEAQPDPGTEQEAPSKDWISILENTVDAPWLFVLSPDPEQRLRIAYVLLFQIVLYLTRPTEAEQFIVAFGTAPASPNSEIDRARKAVGTILRATVYQLSSIPSNSPLHSAQAEIFDIFGALHAIHDMYLTDDVSALETWSDFWTRAQPVVLELGMKLDEKGFGLTEADWSAMTASEKQAENAPKEKAE